MVGEYNKQRFIEPLFRDPARGITRRKICLCYAKRIRFRLESVIPYVLCGVHGCIQLGSIRGDRSLYMSPMYSIYSPPGYKESIYHLWCEYGERPLFDFGN